jgi:hypothetical protein
MNIPEMLIFNLLCLVKKFYFIVHNKTLVHFLIQL